MAAFEIMIPDVADLPAYILDPDLARAANEDAMSGVSTGFPPRVKMSGKQFCLVDGSGDETAIPMGQLFKGPDENLYLKTVVLRAKKDLQKRWYLRAFNPNEAGAAPDCFSNDGQRPDATIPEPQCDTCANCPMNAYGSGSDDKGTATNGKACSDNKMLAVFLPSKGVHELKITPASLKNWGLYVKALTSRGIAIGNVFTLVGFVNEATYPVLTFQYGGPIPEGGVSKLAALAASPEAEEIVTQRITYSAPSAPAQPAEKPKEAPKKAAPKKTAPKPKAVPKKEEPVDDGLGLNDAPVTEELPEVAAAEDTLGGMTDADLADELGL